MAAHFAVLGNDPPPMRSAPSTPSAGSTSTNGKTDAAHRNRTKDSTDPKAVGNRFAVLNRFADFTLGKLTKPEIAVWLLLYRDTKRDGTARTSLSDLARRAGVCDRTAARAATRLEGMGLLKRVRRGGIGRGATLYRVFPESAKQ